MSVNVKMPKLGMTMTTGKVSGWSKKEGDQVEKGEDLFEVETEKITNKVEAPASGILFQIVVPAGETVPVGTIVAVIAEKGEQPERIEGFTAEESADAPVGPATEATAAAKAEKPKERGEIIASPAAKRLAKELGIDLALVTGTGPNGRIVEGDVTDYKEQAGRKPKITPLAEEIARQAGLDISLVTGTGEGGKITREDVERALRPETPAAPVRESSPDTVIPMAGIRKAIAVNMHASLQNTAQLTLHTDVDVTESVSFINLVREQYKKDESVRVSMNDMLILAVSRALKLFPIMNSTQVGEEIILHARVNMGIAVALTEGLIVPVLPDADRKGLLEIAREARALVNKARTGGLAMDEVTGGTFTITNLSSSRVTHFTPILRPPETGILGLGCIVDKPVVVKGEIQVRPVLGLSLTVDHRVVDGAPAADFLSLLARFLEQPKLILV